MRRKRQSRAWLSLRAKRATLVILGAVGVLFGLLNLALWGIYHNRTYPNTQLLGKPVGNIPYGQLSKKVSDLALLPDAITFAYDNRKVIVRLQDLGIYKEAARTTASAKGQRSWLPLLNLLKSPQLKAPIAVDSNIFDAKAKHLAEKFYREPTNAKLVLEDTAIHITHEQAGYSLDQAALQEAIFKALDRNVAQVQPPIRQTTAKVLRSDLQDEKQLLEQQLNTVVTYKYNGKTRQTSTVDTARWFTPAGETYTISNEAVRDYVTQIGTTFGIRIKEIDQVISASAGAVVARKPTEISLTAQIIAKKYTYCVAAKGVDAAYLANMHSKLQATYADSRGWSLEGRMEFKEVSSGCNFTVWLAAANLMPTFGAICDPSWSCRVGSNVVINFDRWQNASEAWNANGGTLDEYRSMVINHETGHWLGFGHANCPGPGLQAPVMQQQSINLQSCVFNAWPTTGEQATLRSRLGI